MPHALVETLFLGGIASLLLGLLVCIGIAYPRALRDRALERRGDETARAATPPPAAAPAYEPPPLEIAEPIAAEPVVEERPPAAAAPPTPAPAPPRVAPDYKRGLRISRKAFIGRLQNLLSGKGELDSQTLEEVEEILFAADLGVATADDLLQVARSASSPGEVTARLESRAVEILAGLPPAHVELAEPVHVILVVGVNGSGKTTSIGKLAHRYMTEGKRVMVAAADTYRAAAIDQLAVWAERAGVDIVKGTPGGDPASVAFDAVKSAPTRDVNVVIIDTAGRLQTDQGLMDELNKIQRVVQKEIPSAPHEVILVLDGNTGQNAIRQAQEFSRSVTVSSILLSKLDGTAKGGVVLGIAQEIGLPVRYVGMGEGVGDLYDFDAEEFARALFAPADSGEATPS